MAAVTTSRASPASAPGLGLLAVLATLSWPALAQERGGEVRVVVNPVPPLVMEQGGQLTGFSIDLWNEVAARLQLKTSYRVVPDVAALAAALRSNQADVVGTGIFYTAERDREFDFSYSILNTGLQVMVPGNAASASDRPLQAFLRVLFSGAMIYWLVAALLLILVPAHVIWLLDRRSEDSVSQGEKYFPGILYALLWSAEAMVGQAQQMPGRRLARLLAILWLFTGVVFVAFFTAQLTSDLTVQQIRGAINGPQDLPGKRVGTMLGSPAMTYLRELGAQAREFTKPEEMYSALGRGDIEAVVFGAPALRYYAAHEGLGKARMVGPEFRKGELGFVLPLDSRMRKRINNALLALKEDGTYQRLHEKWFGSE
jgi:polar amino acid transport system substrate-binding protein